VIYPLVDTEHRNAGGELVTIDLSAAGAIITAAVENATVLGARVSVAVVDAGGNLVAFSRMDGAEIAGPSLGARRARRAALRHSVEWWGALRHFRRRHPDP
jgi:uncharacterized protein GlcG (DUF336 family)